MLPPSYVLLLEGPEGRTGLVPIIAQVPLSLPQMSHIFVSNIPKLHHLQFVAHLAVPVCVSMTTITTLTDNHFFIMIRNDWQSGMMENWGWVKLAEICEQFHPFPGIYQATAIIPLFYHLLCHVFSPISITILEQSRWKASVVLGLARAAGSAYLSEDWLDRCWASISTGLLSSRLVFFRTSACCLKSYDEQVSVFLALV